MSNRLSDYKVKKIILCFCEDIDATKTSRLLCINRNTINRYYNIFRERIFYISFDKNYQTSGEFECDEIYFGAKRVRGKRRQGVIPFIQMVGRLMMG